MRSPAGCARQALCDVSTSHRFRARTQDPGGTFPQPQLNWLGVTHSCDALRRPTLQSGEGGGHTMCLHPIAHTRVPGRVRAHQLAERTGAAVTICLGAFPGSAHLSRCEVRQTGRQACSSTGGYGPNLPMERRAPCTHSSEPGCPGYTFRLKSACPDHPLCSLGLGAGSCRIHTARWNVLSLQQIISPHLAPCHTDAQLS